MDAKLKETALENLKDELNGAYLYDALAQAEKDERLAEVYRRMAAVERCAGGEDRRSSEHGTVFPWT